jgi:hypothetical protein
VPKRSSPPIVACTRSRRTVSPRTTSSRVVIAATLPAATRE